MNTRRTYFGHSSQMAVMGELLFRGCNVSIPEVDVGTDVFAFHDDREDVARIQVKAAQGKRYKKGEGHGAQFNIPTKQLERPDRPPLYYALAVRLEGQWVDFLVISRPQLNDYWNGPQRFGTENKKSGDLTLTVQFRPNQVLCGEVDLTEYRNAWEKLPPFRPLPDVTAVDQGGAAFQAVVGQATVKKEEGEPPQTPPQA